MKIELNTQGVKFNYIRTRKKLIKGSFPDFLILGPQRTGTTWLYDKLYQHPEIYMSHPKEIFFYNRLGTQQLLYSYYFHLLLTEKPTTILDFFVLIAKCIRIDILQTQFLNANLLEWYLTFFNDNWIVRLSKSIKFREYKEKLKSAKLFGEATASTFRIKEEIIEDILNINPNIKAIFLIRNPISRAWSHAKLELLKDKRRNIKDISFDEFRTFFESPHIQECALYLKHINKWNTMLKSGNLYIGFYDDLTNNPELFLKSILSFLEIDKRLEYLESSLTTRVLPTSEIKIPKRVLDYLNLKYDASIDEIEKTYPGKINY